MVQSLEDTSKIDNRIKKTDTDLKAIADAVSELIHKNSTQALSQEEYNKAYNDLTKKYEKKASARTRLMQEKQDREYRITEIKAYIEKLKSSETVMTEWDDMLWTLLIDRVTVFANGKMTFLFKDGTEIEA